MLAGMSHRRKAGGTGTCFRGMNAGADARKCSALRNLAYSTFEGFFFLADKFRKIGVDDKFQFVRISGLCEKKTENGVLAIIKFS